jgi:hypothetical protein
VGRNPSSGIQTVLYACRLEAYDWCLLLTQKCKEDYEKALAEYGTVQYLYRTTSFADLSDGIIWPGTPSHK